MDGQQLDTAAEHQATTDTTEYVKKKLKKRATSDGLGIPAEKQFNSPCCVMFAPFITG